MMVTATTSGRATTGRARAGRGETKEEGGAGEGRAASAGEVGDGRGGLWAVLVIRQLRAVRIARLQPRTAAR